MITFGTENGRFTYRGAGIAIASRHVLVHRSVDDDFWALPGGRVEMMEPAHEALRREMLEETGLSVSVRRLIWIVENFFQHQGTAFHEVGLYFETSVPPDVSPKAKSFQGKEGETPLEFRWATFDVLLGLGIRPEFLATHLRNLPATT